ncbi:MAG: AarF/ABC1/UbiB kinase family protein [Myxococcales bacterium]|nr:AarF/ABC1/UbiB kinase family protein [Myxococcales bacterium]
MARDPEEKVPGRLMRTLKTGWLGSTVASSYLGGKLLDKLRGEEPRAEAELARHLQNAKRIATTMKELRGPMMKVGQLLSTHAEALPGEYGEVLRSLQSSAPPMKYETIRDVIEMDLGGTPESLFASFDKTAMAAASLGQVHRARLKDGTDVVVKVQYPGASAGVEGDLKNLKLGAQLVKTLLADTVKNERLDLTPVADEIAEHLAQETDYCREAYNAQLMAKLFEGVDWVLIPRVHLAYSGLHTITYDYLPGEDLGAALASGDQARRDLIVTRLSDAFWFQMLKGGVLHADPHPGNYRILPDGRLGILDYGCIKVFDEAFLTHFSAMVRARMQGDDAALDRAMIALGLIEHADDPDERRDMLKIADYFSMGLAEDAPFSFADHSYVRGAKELVLHFLQARRVPPSQRNMIFMTRVVLGYYEYFSRARSRLNYRAMVRKWVDPGFTGRAIVIPPYAG